MQTHSGFAIPMSKQSGPWAGSRITTLILHFGYFYLGRRGLCGHCYREGEHLQQGTAQPRCRSRNARAESPCLGQTQSQDPGTAALKSRAGAAPSCQPAKFQRLYVISCFLQKCSSSCVFRNAEQQRILWKIPDISQKSENGGNPANMSVIN